MTVNYLECRERIRRDVKRRYFDVFKEQIKVVGVHDNVRERLVSETLTQHHATV